MSSATVNVERTIQAVIAAPGAVSTWSTVTSQGRGATTVFRLPATPWSRRATGPVAIRTTEREQQGAEHDRHEPERAAPGEAADLGCGVLVAGPRTGGPGGTGWSRNGRHRTPPQVEDRAPRMVHLLQRSRYGEVLPRVTVRSRARASAPARFGTAAGPATRTGTCAGRFTDTAFPLDTPCLPLAASIRPAVSPGATRGSPRRGTG